MSEEANDLKFNFTNIISGLTISTFILGILKLLVFYQFFNFNVFEYIDLSEIVTHALKNAVYIVVSFTIYLYFEITNENKILSNSIQIVKRNVTKTQKIQVWVITITLYSWVIYEYLVVRFQPAQIIHCIILTLIVRYWDYPYIMRKKIQEKTDIKINAFTFIFIYIILIAVGIGLTNSFTEVHLIKYLHTSKGSYIIAGKDSIKSTDNYYYIGRTNNYVFFYNETTSVTDVYPQKDIIKISVK